MGHINKKIHTHKATSPHEVEDPSNLLSLCGWTCEPLTYTPRKTQCGKDEMYKRPGEKRLQAIDTIE